MADMMRWAGLAPAPILLSEGVITNPQTNAGYGLVHIEARHGKEIRNAGYPSVVAFIEEVARHYDVIREGINRAGEQTYMLQLTDRHNNTLMVELSGDGTYYNINTAGIFKTSYGRNRREVYNRHTTANQSTESGEASQGEAQSGTTSPSRMNATTPSSSEDKGSKSSSKSNEKTEKGADNQKKREDKYLMSDARMEELKKCLRAKLGQLNMGIDPEIIAIGSEMAVGYIERGTCKFADYKRKQAEWQENLQTAQAEMDYWNSIKQIHDEALLNAKQEKTSLTDDEVVSITDAMKANAVIAPTVEINDANWKESVDTPIGTVKMGKNQKAKLFAKGREQQYGMLLETLSNPDVVLEEKDKEQNMFHERPSSYLFVKTFQKEDGSKYVHFESVTVSQDGMEVSISSHIIRENQLENKLKSDRLLYKATALDAPANTSAEQPIVGGSLSSAGKDRQSSATKQVNEDKSTPTAKKTEERVSEYNEHVLFKYVGEREDRGNTYLYEDILYNGKEIGRHVQQQRNDDRNPLAVLQDFHEVYLLEVPVSDYDPRDGNEKWTIGGKEIEDTSLGANHILFENEEDLIDFYEKNKDEIEERRKRADYYNNRRATAKVEETHRKRNEIKNRIKKLLGGDKREDYERADEGTKAEVDNLLAEYNGLADNISVKDLLLANRYALEMLNDDSLGVRDQGASLQNRIQVLYSLKHPHRLLLLPMTKAANDSKLARLQSTGERFEGISDEQGSALVELLSKNGLANSVSVESHEEFEKGLETVEYKREDSSGRREKRDEINRNIDDAMSFVTGKPISEVRRKRISDEQARKQKAKEIYEKVLSGEFDDVFLQEINDYINEVTPRNPFGRRLSQRLPQAVERRMYEVARKDQRHASGYDFEAWDALCSRICEASVRPNERFGKAGRRAIEERKKEILKAWAIATGNWHTDLSDFTDSKEPIGSGTDSDVYLSKDGNHVIKLSKGKTKGKFLPDLDNIPLFNYLFPNTAYKIVGYGEINGNFVRILEQPFVDFPNATSLSADERVSYMEGMGFKPMNDKKSAFSNGEIVVADLQKSNIVKDKNGVVRVIDADVKLHTKDFGGKYTYLPVEEDLPKSKSKHHERFMKTNSGTVYGYVDAEGNVHLDASVMNGNTPIHEFGHLWNDWCKGNNAELWGRGVELIKDSPYYEQVKRESEDTSSTYYGMADEQIVDEAIARAIGDKGEKMLEKHGVFKFAQLRDWLVGLWQSLKQKFGVGLNENLEDMTLDEFTTIASRDLLGGEKLHDKATGTDFTHEELSIIDTAKRDKQYLEAVQRGDMDTAKEATEQKDSSANDTARSHAFDKEVNEQFNRELAELTEENADTKIFNIGSPSSILLSAGVEDKPMKLYGNKVVKKMKKHGFALDELRNLPKAVADPIAVFDNIGRIGNRSILTELRTQKGNFLVTIDLGKGGDDVDFNIVSSVFGKDGGNIVDWIERGLATYINKEKAFRYLHHSALSAEALSSSRLSSAAKIVKDFVNPSIAGEESVLHSYTEQRDELDKRYMEAVKRGDMATAQKMLAEEAERKGYTTESDYQGTLAFNGAAPSSNAYYETKAERKEAWDNGDYEGDWSLADELVHGMEMGDLEHRISAREMRRYDDMRRESAQSIRNVRAKLQAGEKNVKIKLYRSVPVGVKEKELRNGDWVTPSKSYAEYHIGLQDWDKGRVIEQEVPIEDVWWDGNDIAEWGYDNGKEEAYKNTPNNRKTFEVTYDDNGNLIPLSKRFDEGNSDTRYRMGDDGASFEERRDKAVANKGTVLPGLTDKQVRVVTVPKHSYKGKNILRQAVEAATKRYNTAHVDEQTGKETWTPKPLHYENDDAEFDYEITEQALKDAAQHSSYSDNAGVHVAVMDKLDEVIGNSIEVEEHPDVLKKDSKRLWSNGFSDDVLIHRFMGAVEIDGKLYRVKTTMRENRSNAVSNKPYTYEVTKIEVLDETSPSTSNGSPYVSDVFVDGAKLLKGVEKSYEKGKKLLEESKKSGGARFGYIGYSMSERAHQARMEGRYPKTDFKKEYDMPQPTLDALVQAGVIDGSEWHHTSKAYNKTTFYGWNDEACIATYKAHKAEIDAWAKGIDPSTGEALPAVDDTNPYHRHDTMPQGSEGRAIEDKVSGKYYDEMEEVARKYENDDKKRHEAIAEIAKRKDEARSAKIRNEV